MTQPPVIPQMIPPETRFPSYVMSSPPMEIPTEPVQNDETPWERIKKIQEEAASERLSAYLEDQSSIASCSMDVLGDSMNEVRTAEWVSEHASVDGSRRSGSAAVFFSPG